MKLVIGYLYPDLMNIYGDTGNVICLQKRAQWRGIEVEIKHISVGKKLTASGCDIYFFGGGQDQAQGVVATDIAQKAQILREEVERGVPLLSICGGYQLLGEYYQPFEGEKLMGVGIFPAYTKASNQRMIGNIVVKLNSELVDQITSKNKTDQLLVGFENHSGKTFLKASGKFLGTVVKGFGNNGEDKTEGCIYKNAIGCYMHGSLLPKNPQLADWLIKKALEVKYGKTIDLTPLDDKLESQAHISAVQRFS